MTHRSAAINRMIVLLAGLVLLGCGAYAVAWDMDVPLVREWVSRYDRERVIAIPDQSWWTSALGATLIFGLLFGAGLLVVNLTRRRTSAVRIFDRHSATTITIDLGQLAHGVAGELDDISGVRHTRARAVVERGLPTLSIVVTADPTIDIADFSRRADDIASTVADTLDGERVATQILLHLDRAEHPEHSHTEGE